MQNEIKVTTFFPYDYRYYDKIMIKGVGDFRSINLHFSTVSNIRSINFIMDT